MKIKPRFLLCNSEAYSEPCQTSKMELLAKRYIIVILQDSEYASLIKPSPSFISHNLPQ